MKKFVLQEQEQGTQELNVDVTDSGWDNGPIVGGDADKPVEKTTPTGISVDADMLKQAQLMFKAGVLKNPAQVEQIANDLMDYLSQRYVGLPFKFFYYWLNYYGTQYADYKLQSGKTYKDLATEFNNKVAENKAAIGDQADVDTFTAPNKNEVNTFQPMELDFMKNPADYNSKIYRYLGGRITPETQNLLNVIRKYIRENQNQKNVEFEGATGPNNEEPTLELKGGLFGLGKKTNVYSPCVLVTEAYIDLVDTESQAIITDLANIKDYLFNCFTAKVRDKKGNRVPAYMTDEIKKALPGVMQEIGALQSGTRCSGPNYMSLNFSSSEKNRMTKCPSMKESLKSKLRYKKMIAEMHNNQRKLIQKRLNLIATDKKLNESTLKSKNMNKLAFLMLLEMGSFYRKGYEPTIIQEEVGNFFTNMGNIFGSSATTLYQTFAGSAVRYILNKLGLGEGMVSNTISELLVNTPPDELPKMFSDCNYFTEQFAVALAEGYVRKLQSQNNLDGLLGDGIRNAFQESLENTEFIESLKRGLSQPICSLWGNIGQKLEMPSLINF